jgi:uncharacterized tellurite resistance protein B-like protein
MTKSQIDEISSISPEEQNQYVESVAFVYLSFCIADGQHEQAELGSVYAALSKWHGVDMEDYQLFLKNFNEVFNQGEEFFQEELNKNISYVINDLKKIDTDSNRGDKKAFLKNLVIIAQADDVITEPEKRWIQNFCNALDLEHPKEILDNPKNQRPKIIELLADQGGGLKEAKEIIDNDSSQVNAVDILMHTHGFTPLHYACWDGKDDLAKYLIKQGANVNAEGTYDTCTPLLLSCEPHQFNCAKLLIEADANLDIRNTDEPSSPLHPKFPTILRLAVVNTSYDLAELLIEKGASVDVLFEPCAAVDGIDNFFENCISMGKEHHPQTFDLERLNKIIEQVSNNESADNKNDLPTEEDKDEDSSTKGPMALTHKTKSDEENQFLRDFIVKWMAETEDFAYAMSRIQFPSFLKEIDDACPVFTDDEITFINHHIDYEKCIPSLPYVHDPTFYNHTKQVWWVAPCVYWGEKLVSWVMVDKNGFYAPHPENWDDQDDVSAIFSWEMIEDISFDIDEFEDHAIATLNIEATNGDELTFYEFLSLNEEVSKAAGEPIFRGSYLSVFKSIFDVNYENIIQSRGAHTWNHGVGMEGFQAFKNPSELLNQSIWEEARTGRMNYKTNEIFDYNPDGEQDSAIDEKIEDKSDEKASSNKEKTESSADEYYFEDYIGEYKLEHALIDERLEYLLYTVSEFLDEKLDGTDGLLQVCSRTGGYSLYADNKLRNGKFAQCRFGKSDRKEGKPVHYFVDLYLLKSKMNYSIDSLPEQSLQSPHAHEFYVVRLYSQDDFKNNKDILEQRLKESLKARQKNKLITKRKNLSRKQLKEEYLRDLGI